MPCLPDSLQPLVTTRFKNYTDCPGYWNAPKSITRNQRSQIVDYLQAVRAKYPAPSPEWLAGRIATLLAHYFLASTDASISTMVGADWIDCLAVFPKEHLDKAVTWWRDNETRKPKPADIRKLAIRFFGETEWEKITRLKEMHGLPIVDYSPTSQTEAAELVKTDDQRRSIAKLLHDSGIAHDGTFCEQCEGELNAGHNGE